MSHDNFLPPRSQLDGDGHLTYIWTRIERDLFEDTLGELLELMEKNGVESPALDRTQAHFRSRKNNGDNPDVVLAALGRRIANLTPK